MYCALIQHGQLSKGIHVHINSALELRFLVCVGTNHRRSGIMVVSVLALGNCDQWSPFALAANVKWLPAFSTA